MCASDPVSIPLSYVIFSYNNFENLFTFSPVPNSLQANVNHSCDPNMSLLNWRNTNVAVANRPIEAGEQLFDTYGALYYHMKTDDRKAYVKVSPMDFVLPDAAAQLPAMFFKFYPP